MKPDKALPGGRLLIQRHGALVRLTHWLNALAIGVLLLSGLQILSAHPAFYWGEDSRFASPLAAIETTTDDAGQPGGRLRIGALSLNTTGLLGASRGADGQLQARAFPGWLTLPAELDLGAGRRWHFFFAWVLVLNGMVYLARGLGGGPSGRRLAGGRLAREILPTRAQLAGLGHDLAQHLRLRFPKGDAARSYSGLQKLAYLPVVLLFTPMMVLTGLAMSPAIDARLHLLSMLFGGRQGARTLHFISVSGILLFVAVHLAMVLLAGPANLLRAMITGGMVIAKDETAP